MSDIKVKVGDPDDLKRVEIVRRIVGPEVPLRIDANGAWTVEEAIRKVEEKNRENKKLLAKQKLIQGEKKKRRKKKHGSSEL